MQRVLFSATVLVVCATAAVAQTSRPDREARRPELHKRSGDAVRAVNLAVNWLVRQQHEDGYWSVMSEQPRPPNEAEVDTVTHRIGLTGLSLLVFLADGNSQERGPYARRVKRGVQWMLDQQDAKIGLIGDKRSQTFIYGHAIATLALAEAAAFDVRDQRLRDATQAALNYLETHRNPYSAWRYQPRDGDNDTSVTGWCTMAVLAGASAGLEVGKNTCQMASSWFDEVTDPATGRTGYAQRGGPSSRHVGGHAVKFPREAGETNTAIGLLCRLLLGASAEDPVLQRSTALVLDRLPVWDPEVGAVDEYYWFFASHALFQVGGAAWDTWSDAVYTNVVPAQRRDDGEIAGSWDPVGVWAHVGGRVYSTALNTLSLQAAYRLERVADRRPADADPTDFRDPRNHKHGK